MRWTGSIDSMDCFVLPSVFLAYWHSRFCNGAKDVCLVRSIVGVVPIFGEGRFRFAAARRDTILFCVYFVVEM